MRHIRDLSKLSLYGLFLLLAFGLLGCSKSTKAGREICEKAATKYIQCIEQTVGKEMADQARSTQEEGTAACARDEKTQAMYEKCLPVKDCDAFMKCLTDYARQTGSKPAPDGATRKEQCAYHVHNGLRGIGLQLVMFSESRPDDSKRKARACVLDDSKEVESCLNEKERKSLDKYAQQRQKDCEAWEPELAACILGLKGAKNCNPDEYPFWREPIIEGAAGPPIAWSIETKETEDEDTQMLWLTDGTLLVLDADGLRAFREGKQLWRAKAQGKDLLAAGKRIITRGPEGSLVFLDDKTGKQKAALWANEDEEVRGVMAQKDGKLLALMGGGQLFKISPAACKGSSTKCAKPGGKLPEDYVPDDPLLAELDNGTLAVRGYSSVSFWDKERKLIFDLWMGDRNELNFFTAVSPEYVAVNDSMGVALLEPAKCAKTGRNVYLPYAAYTKKSLGWRVGGPPEDCADCRRTSPECVVGYRGAVNGDWVNPISNNNGAVAFNDHGFVEKTHLLAADGGGWNVKTGGHGNVAADDKHVYTISFGQDGEGPTSILALALDDGKTVWQTKTPDGRNGVDEYTDTTIVVQGKWLAALVGKKIYAIDLKNSK
jgi:outer membrane protein assembly factor BamB